MTRDDLDPLMGRAIGADGVATVAATSIGGSPTTTYAENIGVMAATRVYSTATYVVAALTAIGFGLSPKFGRGQRDPRRRARRHHRGAVRPDRSARREDLAGEPRRLRRPGEPRAGGGRADRRDRQRHAAFSDEFSLGGIAFGTLVVVIGYHLARALARRRRQVTLVPPD